LTVVTLDPYTISLFFFAVYLEFAAVRPESGINARHGGKASITRGNKDIYTISSITLPMPIEPKIVGNSQYLYFWYYDGESKEKKEVYCGPANDARAAERARALEEQLIKKKISSLQQQLQELEQEGLAQYQKPVARPFVKWAGGKTQLLGKLRKHFPKRFHHYYEPFLGSGSVFFHLVSIRPHFPATISDINRDLINAFRVIQEDVESLIVELKKQETEFNRQSNKADYYNRIRANPPSFEQKIERATWFIFLNKTGYNGLYRVNSRGEFNVPFGDYKKVKLFDADNLRTISKVLSQDGVRILCEDYEKVLQDADRDDFCYLDPPYFPITNGGFTSYTPETFTKKNQEDLKKVVDELTARGCKVLISNSDTEFIRDLYEGYTIVSVEALRMINSDKKGRKGVTELIIRNY
jgi:DNA adenine methylase